MSFIDKLNRFAGNPVNMNMKRSKFNLSHGHKLTFVAGKLIPLMFDEVLPDDTIKLNVSSVVRSITPALPVMDNAYLDIFAFWVPARLTTVHDKDWQKIHGENTAGFWAQSSESTLINTGNTFKIPSTAPVAVQSLADYLGIPIGFYHTDMELSRLPFNAYWLIWNEWFRDQNTQAPIDFKSFDNATFVGVANTAANLASVNKFHDYFTSALPSPQKGNSVLLPIAGSAPVKTDVNDHAPGNYPLRWRYNVGTQGTAPSTFVVIGSGGESAVNLNTSGQPGDPDPGNTIAPANLIADLSAATAVSVNEMRQAFAIQKLFEKDARGGWACAF